MCSDVLYCIQKKGADVMKLYNVYVYNTRDGLDIYTVIEVKKGV
jgi:hypothetical protein